MRCVFFDIEAGGLKIPFDQVICAAFKPYGEKPYVLARQATDTNDKKLCKDIKKELEKYDIIIGYYSLDFDKPFVSGRLLKHGEKPLKRQLHIDCYRLAKKIFKYTTVSKRLISLCELLHIKGKTRVDFDKWEIFKYGTIAQKKKALKIIVPHCKWDVITLEEAFDKCFKHAIVSINLA